MKRIFIAFFIFIISLSTLILPQNNKFNISGEKKEFYGDEEVDSENWEISTVIFDSSVNNGHTALNETNWDASDGGYVNSDVRQYTIQINYKNTNAVKTYEKGEIEIKIPNLITQYTVYKSDSGHSYQDVAGEAGDSILRAQVTISANDDTHTGYDWNFKTQKIGTTTYKNPDLKLEDFYFTNDVVIEQGTNFEGSIQLVYTITSKEMTLSQGYNHSIKKYDSSTEKSFSKTLKSELISVDSNVSILESNTITFNYYRKYIHEWEYSVGKETYSVPRYYYIPPYDGFGEHPENYTWIKYNVIYSTVSSSNPARIPFQNDWYALVEFPEGIVVYDRDYNEVEKTGDYFKIIIPENSNSHSFYIGVPTDLYDPTDRTITIDSTSKLYGKYDLEDEYVFVDEKSVSVSLYSYVYNYGNMYSFYISGSSSTKFEYQKLLDPEQTNDRTLKMTATVYNTGENYDIKLYEDNIFYTTNNGIELLGGDNEYIRSISQIYISDYFEKNYPTGTFDCELWIMREGETDFELYESFKNGEGGTRTDYYPNGYGSWSFTQEDKVRHFYIVIKGIEKTVRINVNYSIRNIAFENIPNEGYIYNSGVMEIFRNINGESEKVNVSNYGYSSYPDGMREYLLEYDNDRYGGSIYRAYCSMPWEFHQVKPVVNYIRSYTGMNSTVIQDERNEKFIGTISIGEEMDDSSSYESYYYSYYSDEDKFKGFVLYSLLPYGMNVESTKEEIISSLQNSQNSWANPPYIRIIDMGTGTTLSNAQIREMVKNNTNVEIVRNYKDTERDFIKIVVDLSDENVAFFGLSGYSYTYRLSFDIKFSISYDNFYEYGNVWKGESYAEFYNPSEGQTIQQNYEVVDSGVYDDEFVDINNNGSEDDYLSYSKSFLTITGVVSTYQDVQTQVETDLSNYSIGKVHSSNDVEYRYKLRVRTGSNKITNLVIYDSIESMRTIANWNGEFVGVDVSNAESRKSLIYDPDNPECDESGYVQCGTRVKVYYSESINPERLYNNNELNPEWKEYDENTVDKSKVKSIAFEYLNEYGDKAILPSSSLTYAIIKMKSPMDENLKTYALNNCWTEWNAIGDNNNPVFNITGIESNNVIVMLPNSIDPDSDAQVIVHYYLENTTTSIANDITIPGKIFDSYETHEIENLDPKYELVSEPTNKVGYMEDLVTDVIYYYREKKADVITRYIDNTTNAVIADETKETYVYGTDYTTEPKQIDDYKLVRDSNNTTGTVYDEDIIVRYYYEAATTVKVRYIDEYTGLEIEEAEIIEGYVGDPYTAEPISINNYTLDESKDPINKVGTMTTNQIIVDYYYKHNSGGVIVNYYDDYTGEKIIPSKPIEGLQGEPYTAELENIPGYDVNVEKYPSNSSGFFDIEPIVVDFYYNLISTVRVEHRNIDTDEKISEDVIITDHQGKDYRTSSKNIEKYQLVSEPDNKTGVMTDTEIVVKYYYKQLSAGVLEKHVDRNTDEILYNELHIDVIGEPYNIEPKEFDNYELQEDVLPTNSQGTMKDELIEVVYYYKYLSTLEVKYIDYETKEIIESKTTQDYLGEKYTTKPNKYEGYQLLTSMYPNNSEGTYAKDKITVNYYYVPESAGVLEKHIDKATGEILYEKLHEGYIGEVYIIKYKEFENYKLDIENLPQNNRGKMKKELIEVDYYYEKMGRVIVEYIDYASGEKLSPDITMELLIGNDYSTKELIFEGYKIVVSIYPQNANGVLNDETTIVKYYYVKESKGVIEKHINKSTNEVLYEEKHEGYVGDPYEINPKEYDGLEVVNKPSNAKGKMREELIEVIYYYDTKKAEEIKPITSNVTVPSIVINNNNNNVVLVNENRPGGVDVIKLTDGNNSTSINYSYGKTNNAYTKTDLPSGTSTVIHNVPDTESNTYLIIYIVSSLLIASGLIIVYKNK